MAYPINAASPSKAAWWLAPPEVRSPVGASIGAAVGPATGATGASVGGATGSTEHPVERQVSIAVVSAKQAGQHVFSES